MAEQARLIASMPQRPREVSYIPPAAIFALHPHKRVVRAKIPGLWRNNFVSVAQLVGRSG